jgi:lysophospholipase L1-like esterase
MPAAKLPFLNTSPTTTPLQRTNAEAVSAHAAALAAVAAGKASGVVFFGDSITAAWAWSGFGKTSWDASLAPLGAVDFGVGSDQTQNLLWRLLNGELGGHPKVAVVMIGTNNLGYGPQQTAAGITAVVKTIRSVSPGTRVLLLGILPRSTPDDPYRSEIAQINGQIARLADGNMVRYLDLGSLFLLPDGTIPPGLMADPTLLLHPSPAGYQLMSDAVRAPIQALLKLPPAGEIPIVHDIHFANINLSLKRSVKALVVDYDPRDRLTAAAANLAAYRLVTVTSTKNGGTHLGKPVSLAKATFDPATNSVTLIPRTTFPILALQLDIKATLVRDPWDQPLNGGHDYIATIRPRGAVTAGAVV